MMNDTTASLNNLPVTMEEDEAMLALEKARQDAPTNETPLPVHDYALMASLIGTFTKHIERIVDQRFAALVESHQTMKLMDDDMRESIAQMIEYRIECHEHDNEHKTDEDIENEVSNHFDYYMRQGNHDFITERNLSEKVGDVLDDIIEDRINAALSNASIEISI